MGIARTSASVLLLALAASAGCGEQDQGRTTENLSPLPEGSGTAPAAATSPASRGGSGPAYDLPAGWQRVTPSSSMRVEEFRVPGTGGSGPAEFVVFHFPGTGGSVQANIDRWIGQFTQPDGTPSAERATTTTIQAGDREVTIVDVDGTYDPGMMAGGGDPLPDHRMLAAIFQAPDGPWFYKLTGPSQTVAATEVGFRSFARSLRLP